MNLTKLKPILTKRHDRPILNCVHYCEDKIIATDSYCMWVETQRAKVEKPFQIRLNDLTVFEGVYPDTSRVVLNKKYTPWIPVKLDDIVIKFHSGVFYYIIDGTHFEMVKVDKALSVFDTKLFWCGGYLFTAGKDGNKHLYYEKGNQLCLILGVRV